MGEDEEWCGVGVSGVELESPVWSWSLRCGVGVSGVVLNASGPVMTRPCSVSVGKTRSTTGTRAACTSLARGAVSLSTITSMATLSLESRFAQTATQ